MNRSQNERSGNRSQVQSIDPPPRTTAPPTQSEAERVPPGDESMEAEFDEDAFVQAFEQATMGIAKRALDAADAIIAVVPDQYVRNVQLF